MVLASSDEAQRLEAIWKSKMAAKGASRAKENLHLDTCFHMRNGVETFREGYYYKGEAFWDEQ